VFDVVDRFVLRFALLKLSFVTLAKDTEVTKRWNVGRIYATIVIAVIWLNAARMFTIFQMAEEFGFVLLVKLSAISAGVLAALQQTACFVASETGNLDRIFRKTLNSVKVGDMDARND